MRRFGWQIGGLGVAVGALVGLGSLAFGCGGGSSVPVGRHAPAASARATATPAADPRVAQVEAAARRYIEALDRAMQTGSPDELDSLSVPGSQAEGNAGIAAHVVHNTGKAFVVTGMSIKTITTNVFSSAATVTVDYVLTGYDASWPALRATDSSTTLAQHEDLELQAVGNSWLVASVR